MTLKTQSQTEYEMALYARAEKAEGEVERLKLSLDIQLRRWEECEGEFVTTKEKALRDELNKAREAVELIKKATADCYECRFRNNVLAMLRGD